jgi:hypothetical protein
MKVKKRKKKYRHGIEINLKKKKIKKSELLNRIEMLESKLKFVLHSLGTPKEITSSFDGG